MTVDLDDLGAVQGHDPGGMLSVIGQLGSHCREGYANGVGAVSLPDLADVRERRCTAGWADPRSPATCCGRCSATGSACRSR